MTNELRWGVLGAAGIAKAAVIPAIQASRNGSITTVASRNPEQARSGLSALGINTVANSYEAVLADPNVDAVYIPLPNHLHGEWTMRAVDAGKAVLVEKPLGLDEAEARRVVEYAGAKGIPVMEGFMYGFHPQHARVLRMIADGAIGEVREVRAHLSVDIMNTPDPNNVRFKPEWGGGTLLDMGWYTTEITRMLIGGKGTVLETRGSVGSEAAELRHKGFVERMKSKHPDVTVKSLNTEWVADNAYKMVLDAFTQDPNTKGVFSHNDEMLRGVASALRQIGNLKPAGQEGHVAMVGLDGTPLALKRIRDGIQDATVEQSPYAMGGAIFDAIVAHFEGRPVPEKARTEPTLVIKANVEDPGHWGNAK